MMHDPSNDVDVRPASPVLGIVLTVDSLAGMLASAMLIIDKLTLLQAKVDGETAKLGCDFNSKISCTDVLSSPQSHVFGFPSPILGLPAFAALCVLGILIAARVDLPRWVWWGLQVAVTLAIVFVFWLQYTSIFSIGVLCPWCMVVWAATIPVFVLVSAHVMRWKFLRDWSVLIIVIWYLLVAATIWVELL